MADKEPSMDERVDRVLNKYVAVWVWSVLFGSLTGGLFSLTSYHGYEFRGLAGLIVAPVIALAGVFALASYYVLLKFLVDYIIPVFFLRQDLDPKQAEATSRQLAGSIKYFLLTVAILILVAVLGLVFSTGR